MGPSRLTRTGLTVGAIAAMFACAEPTSNPSNLGNALTPSLGVFLPTGGTPNTAQAERVEVCKNYVMTSGAQPPALTSFTVNGPGTVNGVFTLAPNTCREVWVGNNESVTITEEDLSASFTQTCLRTLLDASTAACTSGTSATSFVNGAAGAQAGELVVFTNTEIVVPPPEFCTRTLGYWKTHPEDWDDAGDNSPFLTTDTFFNSGLTYLQILNLSPEGGNAYIILAHQYIAAVLNTGGGPSGDDDVDDAISDAAAFFAAAAAGTPAPAKGSQLRTDVLGWATTLDEFNNGITGPGHCED